MVVLCEVGAVLGHPPGHVSAGGGAVRSVYGRMVTGGVHMQLDDSVTTAHRGGLPGARQQLDGSWLWVIDVPEPRFRLS
jgi:hypothetical protein